jgi:hypothetical protein
MVSDEPSIAILNEIFETSEDSSILPSHPPDNLLSLAAIPFYLHRRDFVRSSRSCFRGISSGNRSWDDLAFDRFQFNFCTRPPPIVHPALQFLTRQRLSISRSGN